MLKRGIQWSTDQVAHDERTDAWGQLLTDSYRGWAVDTRLDTTFHARVHQHEIAGAKLVETSCGPCAGRRTKAHVSRDDDLYVGVQLAHGGRERFIIDDDVVNIAAGNLLIWTTGHTAQFEVLEDLRKVTLMLPWRMMQQRFPERRNMPSGGILDHRSGIGMLLAAQLKALSSEVQVLEHGTRSAVMQSTLELLNAALCQEQPSPRFDAKAAMLTSIQQFIAQHLHHDDLNPAWIAKANRISLRYLHMLFVPTGTTLSEYILTKRLEACKQALSSPSSQHLLISEIAFRWGFKSTSHFCRAFKRYHDVAPRDMRLLALKNRLSSS
ncbi:helix-turn-helix domain-containing protein [Rugamonas sp. A1-17]|nr:helix-turn-helix domain-containing protein [Rugamonas sp. A1-17]